MGVVLTALNDAIVTIPWFDKSGTWYSAPRYVMTENAFTVHLARSGPVEVAGLLPKLSSLFVGCLISWKPILALISGCLLALHSAGAA